MHDSTTTHDDDLDRFSDTEVLVVFLEGGPEWMHSGVAIEGPVLRSIGGEVLVTGRVPEAQGDWGAGERVGISWRTVIGYIAFSSLDTYVSRVSTSERRRWK